jgi:hypothetical protein
MPTKGSKIIENENFSNAREELHIQMKINEGDKLSFFINMPRYSAITTTDSTHYEHCYYLIDIQNSKIKKVL